MPNADELNATMSIIKANPHLWDQDQYFIETECGTTACFFGWTLLRHGYEPMGRWNTSLIADRILGLNDCESDALQHYYTDSIEDLELRVKEIIAGEWADRVDEVVSVTPQKIYLASRFSRNDEMRGVRDVLEAMGYTVTSRWIDLHGGAQLESAATTVLNSDPGSVSHFGQHNFDDISVADTVISFTSVDGGGNGVRHVEHGLALGLGKRVIVCGPRENIFHTLPQVEHYSTWRSLAIALATERDAA